MLIWLGTALLMMIRFSEEKNPHHITLIIILSIYLFMRRKKIENKAMHFSSSCTYLSSSSSVNVHLPVFRQYHIIHPFFYNVFSLLDGQLFCRNVSLLNLAVKTKVRKNVYTLVYLFCGLDEMLIMQFIVVVHLHSIIHPKGCKCII